MDNEKTFIHPMAAFPFEELKIGIHRREFFSALLTEVNLFTYKRSGASGMKLSVLGTMDINYLGRIIPVIVPDCKIRVKHKSIYGYLENQEAEIFLFEIDPIISFTFNQINGKTSLNQTALNLSQKFGFDDDESLLIARGLFLTLVKAGVCVPVNNPLNG